MGVDYVGKEIDNTMLLSIDSSLQFLSMCVFSDVYIF
jgi:hypothetical protein